MWSLTSQRERRTSGSENFPSSAKWDFFNNICQKQKNTIDRLASTGDQERRAN